MQNVKVLITNKGELLATPRRELDYTEGYVYIEFVDGPGLSAINTVQLSIDDVPIVYKQSLAQDGLHVYYRLQILTKQHILDNESTIDGRFYYDIITNSLYLGEEKINTSAQLLSIVTLENLTANSSIMDYVTSYIFSLNNLNKCLIEYQRKFILAISNNSTNYCNENKLNKFNRDFLFSTLCVLRKLIKDRNYEEATRILQLVNRCNAFCKDTYARNIQCNCTR